MEHCPNCGGQLKIIAAILDSAVIERILTHLGLQARAPPRTPARERQVAQAAWSRLDGPVSPSNRPSTSGRWGRLRPGLSEASKRALVLRVHP